LARIRKDEERRVKMLKAWASRHARNNASMRYIRARSRATGDWGSLFESKSKRELRDK
jgi:hypothetical protein